MRSGCSHSLGVRGSTSTRPAISAVCVAANTDATFEKTFPALTAKANGSIRMLWITCGTADSLIGVNRQFKEWLRSKDVRFTEEEVPDIGHVWPLWRRNLTEFAQKVFQR